MRWIFLLMLALSLNGGEKQMKAEEFLKSLHWLGHDSFRIDYGGTVIYIDPWQIRQGPKADLIFVTHGHSDHCDPESIAALSDSETVVIAPATVKGKLSDNTVKWVEPGDTLILDGVECVCVPAYNTNKFRAPGQAFHPREDRNTGYVLNCGGVSLYHSGDTDVIPEMADVNCDIALLPVSGIYVMTRDKALEAVNEIEPLLAIPMHVGRGIGSPEDAEYFVKKLGDKGRLLPME